MQYWKLEKHEVMFYRGVHGYTDKGGELKNMCKYVFEEALDK